MVEIKTEIRHVKAHDKEIKTYYCGECGKLKLSYQSAVECEKRDRCKHDEQSYALSEHYDEYSFYNGLDMSCKKCGKLIARVEFDDFEDDQDMLKALFEVMNNAE